MALWDQVVSRLPAEFLKSITNAEQTTETGVNTSYGTSVATDVVADMKTFANLVYDDTNAQHVSIGIQGVLKKLQQYRGDALAVLDRSYDEWVGMLMNLAKSRGISKLRPTATSTYTPSTPVQPGEVIEPPFDRDHFDAATVPAAPNSTQRPPGALE